MKNKALMGAKVDDDGNVSVPLQAVPLLSQSESETAHGTQIHALRFMEMLMLSGRMDMKQIMDGCKELAKYQFKPASAIKAGAGEQSAEDWLNSIED